MSKAQSLYDFLNEQEQNEDSFDSGVSLEKWRELGENGVTIPLKIPLQGVSMEPLIRSRKDIVTIMPLVRDPVVGDIVLFRRNDGKNIVHRVCRVFPDGIQTWGDNCYSPDPFITISSVIGIAVSFNRNGQTINLDSKIFA